METRSVWHLILFIGILTAVTGNIVFAKEDAATPFTLIFDTGTASPQPLAGEALIQRAGFTPVEEDILDHTFQGDAVLLNDKIAVVVRQNGAEVELYSKSPDTFTPRASFSPGGSQRANQIHSIQIKENTSSALSVNVTFAMRGGTAASLLLELTLGQPFVHIKPRDNAPALKLTAASRFAVLPDFFADDMVLDARRFSPSQADLPSENFFFQMLGNGEAILMSVCSTRDQDIRIELSGLDDQRSITGTEIPFGQDGEMWICLLDSPGIWHTHELAKKDAGKIIPLGWTVPFPAQWRTDWQCAGDFTDSWEMLTEQPKGHFVQYGWLGNAESPGTEDWLRKDKRERWTTVLGWFPYPCWIDTQGRGHLQPLADNVVTFEGPALIYPINRIPATPLDRFTIVDLVRATLGVGPCEYILDLEGQKQAMNGIATCAFRDKLNPIYSQGRQKQSKAEIEKALEQVLSFVKHIRGRIDVYIQFGHEMQLYLRQQDRSDPAAAQILDDLLALTGELDTRMEKRKDDINTPEYAENLVNTFRTALLDYEGPDAYTKCKKITAAMVEVGGNQDELVGECRMVVKRLRQQAGLAMALNPAVAAIAKEIRGRTQQILRNPASYEAPRH
ncbi:MAG: hypothetical protein ACE15F_21395 [bacterium]